MKSDRLLYKATALDESANSSAEQSTNEGSGLSSAGKGSEISGNEQGNGAENGASLVKCPLSPLSQRDSQTRFHQAPSAKVYLLNTHPKD